MLYNWRFRKFIRLRLENISWRTEKLEIDSGMDIIQCDIHVNVTEEKSNPNNLGGYLNLGVSIQFLVYFYALLGFYYRDEFIGGVTVLPGNPLNTQMVSGY